MRVFHLVCHSCDAENVVVDEDECYVRELLQAHRESNPDHRMVYDEVDHPGEVWR